MQRTLKPFVLLFLAAAAIAACRKNYDGVVPGNYIARSEIGTFAGDTVLLSGQVSTPAGIETVSLECEGVGLKKIYDLSSEKPSVYNYEYSVPVPKTASLPQEIKVTVCAANGEKNVGGVTLKFTPDMTKPVITTSLPAQVGVELDPSAGIGVWNCSIAAKDERELASITVEIPGISYSKTVSQSGRSGLFEDEISFTEVASYPAAIIATDAAGNRGVLEIELVVTPVEEQDPISDYAQMYIFDAEENPADYIDGLFHYMYRQDAGYEYKANIRTYKANTKLYISPVKNADGDIFGVSPYVSSKILNKRGYAVPVVIPEAGCYEFTVSILNQSYSVTPIERTPITGPFYISGVGFSSFADWGTTDALTDQGNDVYSIVVGIDGSAATHQYYFYTDGWATVYRCDEEGNEWCIAADGPCIKYSTEYTGNATFYLDTALPWAWIKY